MSLVQDEQSGLKIYPTGTCFEDATLFMFDRLKEDVRRLHTDEFILVHAIVWPETEKKKFSHAWVERADTVITFGVINGSRVCYTVDKKEYYTLFNVLESDRYTFLQAVETERKSRWKNPPWKRKYRRLCKEKSPFLERNP